MLNDIFIFYSDNLLYLLPYIPYSDIVLDNSSIIFSIEYKFLPTNNIIYFINKL